MYKILLLLSYQTASLAAHYLTSRLLLLLDTFSFKHKKILDEVLSSFNTVTMQRKSCDQNAGKEPLVTMLLALFLPQRRSTT